MGTTEDNVPWETSETVTVTIISRHVISNIKGTTVQNVASIMTNMDYIHYNAKLDICFQKPYIFGKFVCNIYHVRSLE